ncbi:uncharacterized protein N7479_007473 [Penicillium vulpinum]|uniref:CFEM domain-containing protein n=1 Tax=Penicillium vulpinum TaxID=29845 RepID=A0A1V6SAT2_9EURO|nr:uncharacterized protein N7479_007473 [Penicillium vulpinum]KAJ5960323.1 hypothetical protein N7479_007473 [Penicillium vulpinum]OQE10849.1 hypothetical protein PENVUL_c003G04061 [Penicillium vulpinum]
MLLLPIHKILITILLLLALCSAAEDISSDASNSALYDMVPDCAKDCVDSFIKSEYTPMECTSPSNIKCLCRTRSTSGLTLGEAALSCVLSVCSQTAIAKSKAYHMCDSVSEALPKTHQTITATVFADISTTKTSDEKTTTEATSTSSTRSSINEHISGASVTTAAVTSTPTSTTSSQTSEITFYVASSSSESQVGPTSSIGQNFSDSSEDTNKKASHAMTPAAIIGMSVASGVAGSFIIGVAVFFCCKRWRRKQREQAAPHNFEIGGAMSEPSDFSKPMPRLPTDGLGIGSSYSPASERETVSQQPRTFHSMATGQSLSRYSSQSAAAYHSGQNKKHRDQERIGFAISSESDWEASPRTQSSQHSVARLLPDPTAGLYPKPLKWSHRPPSGETLFEEDESQQVAGAVTMHNNSPRLGIRPKLAGLPSNPRAFKEGFSTRNLKRGSGTLSTLTPPFNPSPAFQTPSSDRGAAPSETPETPQNDYSSSNPKTLLAASVGTIQTQTQNRSLSPGRQALPPCPVPSSSNLPLGSEIVSKPRIVRGNDIKRVQIRNSPRPPSEVIAPYCPDDLWLERGRALAPPKSREPSGELPYPSDMYQGAVHYPDSPSKKAGAVSNRISPTSRNLTPSRRGDDLILSVD